MNQKIGKKTNEIFHVVIACKLRTKTKTESNCIAIQLLAFAAKPTTNQKTRFSTFFIFMQDAHIYMWITQKKPTILFFLNLQCEFSSWPKEYDQNNSNGIDVTTCPHISSSNNFNSLRKLCLKFCRQNVVRMIEIYVCESILKAKVYPLLRNSFFLRFTNLLCKSQSLVFGLLLKSLCVGSEEFVYVASTQSFQIIISYFRFFFHSS